MVQLLLLQQNKRTHFICFQIQMQCKKQTLYFKIQTVYNMNPYKDFKEQTKRKPLIGYKNMKFNTQTIPNKERHKKDLSIQKENNKYNNFENDKILKKPIKQNYIVSQEYRKSNTTYASNSSAISGHSGHALSQLPIHMNSNMIEPNIQQTGRNLTFGTVKNAHKGYVSTNPNASDHNYNISLNVNIQNLPNNQLQYKKKGKYQIKALNVLRNQPIQTTKKTTLLINQDQRKQRKQKLKKQIQHTKSSPLNDKQFLCEEEMDFMPVEKRQMLPLDRKVSEKRLLTLNGNHIHNAMFAQKKVPKKVEKKVDHFKQLKDFQKKQIQINSIFDFQALTTLLNQQQKYRVSPMYLQQNQKAINWMVRAVLMDWMRQLSFQYQLKRDTYHLAITLLDKYLAKKQNIQKQIAQVIGATTLFIASKIQELECRSSEDFAQSTQGICTAKDIRAWQLQICKALEFNLNPPTICSLANRIMAQWDTYIDEANYAVYHPCFDGLEKPYFKKLDQESFRIFRQLLQFIDCAVLDIQTSQYKPMMIILSFMYLILGAKIAGYNYNEIHQVFPRKSHYLIDQSNPFNDLFEDFVRQSFSLALVQLLPTVQYSASYFNLFLTYEKPMLEKAQEDLEEMNIEEYSSYQTYNRHMLKTVNSRQRGILNTF